MKNFYKTIVKENKNLSNRMKKLNNFKIQTPIKYENVINYIIKWEKKHINEKIEKALVITQQGEVYELIGDKNHIDIDIIDDLNKINSLENAIITHNHPKDETKYTFSKEDINIYKEYKLSILRGFDYKYYYELNKNYKNNNNKINILVKDMDEELYNHLMISIKCNSERIGYQRHQW